MSLLKIHALVAALLAKCAVVGLLQLSCLAQDSWQSDVDAAQRVATAQGKIVVLHFWAPWCKPCKNLDRFVFNNPNVKKSLASEVVAVKVNVDIRSDLARKYGVKSIPADVAISPTGQQLAKRQSPGDADSYVRMLKSFAAMGQSIRPDVATLVNESNRAYTEQIEQTNQFVTDRVQQTNQIVDQARTQLAVAQPSSTQQTGFAGFGGGAFQLNTPSHQAPSHRAPNYQAPGHQAPSHQAPNHSFRQPAFDPTSISGQPAAAPAMPNGSGQFAFNRTGQFNHGLQHPLQQLGKSTQATANHTLNPSQNLLFN